ncbi:transposase [Acrocarpospora corrugata]|uniref:transposase n=1 Tax=Acrocarpospora corrugata TaxID=35763 RepID=UPI003BEEE88E
MVLDGDRPVTHVARELGIHDTTLHNWVRAWRRRQEGGEEGSVLGREPRPGTDAELPFEDGDLVTQGEDLDVLVPISHREQPQRREGVRDGEIGQAKEHDRSSCRTGSSSGVEACVPEKSCKAVTWTDGIIGRRRGTGRARAGRCRGRDRARSRRGRRTE